MSCDGYRAIYFAAVSDATHAAAQACGGEAAVNVALLAQPGQLACLVADQIALGQSARIASLASAAELSAFIITNRRTALLCAVGLL